MTDKKLKEFIIKLNQNKADEDIFLQSLTDTVDYAIVWDYSTNQFTKEKKLNTPYQFYFIKNETSSYVGTVYVMSADLHWFVLPKYRGKGFLTNSLKDTILPHLFQDNRDEQRITIDQGFIGDKNYKASLKVANSVGFIQTNVSEKVIEMKISKNHFRDAVKIKGKVTKMSEERINIITERATQISRMLWKIETELEIKMGLTNDIAEIKEIIEETGKISDLIHGTYWENN